MEKSYRSAALAPVHETALGLASAGILNKQTMKMVDTLCLTPVEAQPPAQIQQVHRRWKRS